jgi:SAM-dependent methyltransferase
MDVPRTVRAALADRPVEGAVCLEAGAGVGNVTCGLLDAGAEHVYAVTNDPEHARLVRDRLDAGGRQSRASVLEADVRALPLPADSVGLVTAHGLFTLVAPAELAAVVSEVTRVASPGSHLVVDDYEPLPEDAEMRRLFALANAATAVADGRPAATFYPADVLRRLFVGSGWTFDRRETLLDPVPWTESHVRAHVGVARRAAERIDGALGAQLAAAADRTGAEIGSESVGEMYSLAFRVPGSPTPGARSGEDAAESGSSRRDGR